MGKSISILFLLLAITVHGQNNSVYNQTWISGAIQKNFNVKEKGNALNIRLDGSYRSIEWFNFERQFLIRGIATWNFNDTWRFGAGPCWSWQYPYYIPKPVLEFRPTAQLTYLKVYSEKTKFGKNFFDWSLRFRWETRFYKNNEEWTDAAQRPRLALRTNIPLMEKLSFAPQAEAMWQQNPDGCYHFSVFRLVPTFNWKLNGINFQIGYMFQFLERGTNDEIDNNYLFNVSN